MLHIRDIIKSLNAIKLPNEEILYSFMEFNKAVKSIREDDMEIDDCILTPYYLFEGRRLELYEYELNIRLVDKPNLEKYLLKKTGKFKVDDIPPKVVEIQKNCYFEVSKMERKIPIKKIQQYINYLFHSGSLKCQVQQVFDRFKIEELLFEFY